MHFSALVMFLKRIFLGFGSLSQSDGLRQSYVHFTIFPFFLEFSLLGVGLFIFNFEKKERKVSIILEIFRSHRVLLQT